MRVTQKKRSSLTLEGRGPKEDMDAQGPSRIEKSISRDMGEDSSCRVRWLGGGFVCGVGRMGHP